MPSSDEKESKQQGETETKEQDPSTEKDTNNSCNDLIIDEGFPALNTFHSNNNDTNESFPKFSFASYPSALNIHKDQKENIIHDCNLTFTARAKEDNDAYSSGATFFIPASVKPRCAFEELALKIFQTHTKHLVPGKHYDIERSGAEWWTLVLDTAAGSSNDNSNDDEDEEDDDEVGMHFDADYGLEEQLPNYMLHPRVATVTYFSHCGVPTFIMNKKSPPPTDIEKQSLNGCIHKGWISCPILGKHIAFDGRLLHGAIGTFIPSEKLSKNDQENDNDEERMSKRRKLDENEETKDSKDTKRITFMVNVWLNHCPIDAELIDDDICQQMKTYWEPKKSETNLKSDSEPLQWTVSDPDKSIEVLSKEATLGKGDSDSLTEIIESVICNRNVTIKFRPCEETLQEIAKLAHTVEGKSIEVCFPEKALELKVGDLVADIDDENDEE